METTKIQVINTYYTLKSTSGGLAKLPSPGIYISHSCIDAFVATQMISFGGVLTLLLGMDSVSRMINANLQERVCTLIHYCFCASLWSSFWIIWDLMTLLEI